MKDTKPFKISKHVVMEAYKRVKANRGSAGVDHQSLKDFAKDLKKNLYKIWNRMSSGTYFPPAVKQVEIPKADGGIRKLGIPTVSDRVAQMVAKLYLEPKLEPIFHDNSYGYRPNRSPLQAIERAREMCFKYSYVVEFDIKGLFDNIDHDLLMKVVRKHTSQNWIILYIERWLKAPFQMVDGKMIKRESGTPQGGVISPLLSNLFLHYTFDVWMERNYPRSPFERFADDGIVHCNFNEEAREIMASLERRFLECKLEIHPIKSKIVYCKDGKRKWDHPNTKFNFLGYEFRARTCKSSKRIIPFVGFTPGVSREAKKKLMDKIRSLKIQVRTDSSLEDIRKLLNPILTGWINYFGVYTKSAMYGVLRMVNLVILSWARRKFKRFGRSLKQARKWLRRIYELNPNLFSHWKVVFQM